MANALRAASVESRQQGDSKLSDGRHSESWQRLIDLAGQPQGSGDDVGMSLASAGGEGGSGKPDWANSGGGSGGIKSDKKAWNKAAHDVGSLRGNIKKAQSKLDEGQEGVGAGSDTGGSGVASAAAQRKLYHSWKRYFEDVSGRCGTLQDRLEKAGDDHYKNDEATKGAFDKLDEHYKDTAHLGGQKRGE